MRLTATLAALLLYGAAASLASPALAGGAIAPAALDEIRAMREGDMAKLAIHDAPRDLPDMTFQTEDGAERRLSDLKGQVTVLNLWATWCGPCREEMPALDRLHAALAGDGIAVAALNVERNGLVKARNFYRREGIENLAVQSDESVTLGARLGVIGYPVTLVLDAEGREIARMLGAAAWDSPLAQAILRRMAAEDQMRKEG
jgi:thiol-disulfide isomerase/thioredoxin